MKKRNQNIRKIPIIYGHWVFKLPMLRNYRGIVIGRSIWFKGLQEEVSEELLRHEMIHQEQMYRHSVFMFYMIYLKDYVKNLFIYHKHYLAYRNIPFEKEAFERQNEKRG